jgi:hypothetical protein
VTVEEGAVDVMEDTGVEVDCEDDNGAVEDCDCDGVVVGAELAVLVIESVDVTTVSVVVTAVLVTTVVPFPVPVACLFANSIKLSAASASC